MVVVAAVIKVGVSAVVVAARVIYSGSSGSRNCSRSCSSKLVEAVVIVILERVVIVEVVAEVVVVLVALVDS